MLGLLGVGFGGFDALLVRPAMLSFARTGRPATGTVLAKAAAVKVVRPVRGHGEISVDDAELGAQLLDGDGRVPVGGQVAVLCSTPAGRCERIALVEAYGRWPRTPNMARAAALLAAAAVMAAVGRRLRAAA
jgi:hypothetical protein